MSTRIFTKAVTLCSQVGVRNYIQANAMSKPILNPFHAMHWILDWDGTLTKRDTLDALVNIAKDAKSNDNIHEAWTLVQQAYLSDYEAALKSNAPDERLPSTVLGERQLLQRLKEVEQRSIIRVSESGIFKDLTVFDIEEGAAKALQSKQVQLRDGCLPFLQHLRSRMDSQITEIDMVDVLSVNWSQWFIYCCLWKAESDILGRTPNRDLYEKESITTYGSTKKPEIQHLLSGSCVDFGTKLSTMSIYANELQGFTYNHKPNPQCKTTGVLCGKGDHQIISSQDKLAYLQRLRKINPCTMNSIPVVYVGDSWTDLECLLAADLGICIRDDPMTSSQTQLQDSFTRLGIECPHLQDCDSVDDWGVVWARDFTDIMEWMQGLEAKSSNNRKQAL